MLACTVLGCDQKHSAKGLCKLHHTRFVRHGDPLVRKNIHHPTSEDLLAKFYRNVPTFGSEGDGCWLWDGVVTTNGYGRMASRLYAHRFSYTQFVGPIPKGKLVCHTCDVRLCVRPSHFFMGTHQDNNHDMAIKGRARKGQLSLDTVTKIRMLCQTKTQKEVAVQFGVHFNTISKVVSGEYRHRV